MTGTASSKSRRLSVGLKTARSGSGVRVPLQASAAFAGTGTFGADAVRAIDIALDASEPRVLAMATRLVAEIERHVTGFRVRIVEAGSTLIRVEIRDELHRQIKQFEEEVGPASTRLQSAADQIKQYRALLLQKDQGIEKFT